MNKAEFLSKPAANATDKAAQLLLRTQSMTAMKEIKRTVSALTKLLYGEDVERLPLAELSKAVEKAAYLIVDWETAKRAAPKQVNVEGLPKWHMPKKKFARSAR